jgi:hypothetical protein
VVAGLRSSSPASATLELLLRCDNPIGYMHDHHRHEYIFELRRRASRWIVDDVRVNVT